MAANIELFPEPTFPITPISCPCKGSKKLFNFLRSTGQDLRLLLYVAIFCVMLTVTLRNKKQKGDDGKTPEYDKRDRAISCVFCRELT